MTELDRVLADSRRAARIREGLAIAVTGPPNVGKSSLVNALSARDAAIVTAIPGTTRDPIEVPLDLGGAAATLIDTAGLRETDDPIEREGIARARARAEAADLVLHVADRLPKAPPDSGWLILNKIDLLPPPAKLPHHSFAVSALTGSGVTELRAALSAWAADVTRPGEPALLGHARHRAAFADAAAALADAAASDDAGACAPKVCGAPPMPLAGSPAASTSTMCSIGSFRDSASANSTPDCSTWNIDASTR